jgi:hypothetical protein
MVHETRGSVRGLAAGTVRADARSADLPLMGKGWKSQVEEPATHPSAIGGDFPARFATLLQPNLDDVSNRFRGNALFFRGSWWAAQGSNL